MRCTVCFVDSSQLRTDGTWSLTSSRTPCSQLQVLFKLFDVTNFEFEAGAICPECHQIIVDIDILEDKLRKKASLQLDEFNEQNKKANKSTRQRTRGQMPKLIERNPRNITATLKPSLDVGASFPCVLQPQSSSSTLNISEPQPTPCSSTTTNMDMDEQREENNEDSDESTEADIPRRGRSCFNASQQERVRLSVNMSNDNLDHDVIHTKSSRDSDLIIYRNHIFHFGNRQSKYKKLLKWRCRNRSCRASIRTTPDCSAVLLDSVKAHNHSDSHEGDARRAIFTDRVREMAVNHPHMRSDEVVSNAIMLNDNSDVNAQQVHTLVNRFRRDQQKDKTEEQKQMQHVQIQASAQFGTSGNSRFSF